MSTAREQAIEDQEHYYHVVVSGGWIDRPIRTIRETITADKCVEIAEAVEEHAGFRPTRIDIHMTQWDYESVTDAEYDHGMAGLELNLQPIGPRKEAVYYPRTACLQIWEDGLPIYEDNAGTITRDQDALADCLL